MPPKLTPQSSDTSDSFPYIEQAFRKPPAHHVTIVRGVHLGRLALRALGDGGLADLAHPEALLAVLAQLKRLRLALAAEATAAAAAGLLGEAIEASQTLASEAQR